MINDLFLSLVPQVTSKLTKDGIVPMSVVPADENGDFVHIYIYSHGAVESAMDMAFSRPLADGITEVMSRGSADTDEMRLLYLKEYVNILCGKAISAINDTYTESSRLTVPYGAGERPEPGGTYSEQSDICFECDEGTLRILVKYSVMKDIKRRDI